jgi:hypothetical protein
MEYEFVLISIGFCRFSDSDGGFGGYSCFEISAWVRHFVGARLEQATWTWR